MSKIIIIIMRVSIPIWRATPMSIVHTVFSLTEQFSLMQFIWQMMNWQCLENLGEFDLVFSKSFYLKKKIVSFGFRKQFFFLSFGFRKQNSASVAHCPNSNFTLQSGVFDVRRVIAAKVKIGYGANFYFSHSFFLG